MTLRNINSSLFDDSLADESLEKLHGPLLAPLVPDLGTCQ
jgi:hypothetical protein